MVKLEAKIMGIAFPAGGSLYYARDLERVGVMGARKANPRFCVGQDTSGDMWRGRRSQIAVDRGP